MKKYIGIWLDHEKATIVTLANKVVTVDHLHAQSEEDAHQLHGASSATHFGHQDITPERKIERRHKEHIHHYYKNIISEIADAEKIFIFGPGEAKIELEREIQKSNGLASKIIGIEASDKMTVKHIIHKVKKCYLNELNN